MDGALRTQIRAIARDHSSGASELSLRACGVLAQWLRRAPHPESDQLWETAAALLEAQPAMAPLLRIANELALAADGELTSRELRLRLANFASAISHGTKEIARAFRRALDAGRKSADRKKVIVTYSRSATVLAALQTSRSKIRLLICSESRPGLEGRALARELRKKRDGMVVMLTTDAALHLYLRDADALALGADSLEEDGFANKIGTAPLVVFAEQQGTPVWVLADSTKILPPGLSFLRAMRSARGATTRSTRKPSDGGFAGALFEKMPYTSHVRVLAEQGWFSPASLGGRARAIAVSPRLANFAAKRD